MLLMGFSFGSDAVAFLDKMQPGKLRAQIAKKAKSLLQDAHPPGCKKLANVSFGDDPVWRIRSGDYRILYVVRTAEIIVIDIGNRKDIYR